MKKHVLNAVIGIALASLFLWLTFRNQPVDDVLELLGEARTGWIFAAVAMLLLVFFLRAVRWKLLLENSGEKAALKDVSYSLLLGFFINAFTPKLGEVIRCTSLEKSSNIKTSRSLGTVLTERIYDLIALVSGIVLILVLEADRLGPLVSQALSSLFKSISGRALNIIIVAVAATVVIMVLFKILRGSGSGRRIKEFAGGVKSTLKMTFRIRSTRSFIVQTILIWGVMVLMNYACLRALPSTDSLSLYFAMVALFIGTIGWAIPSPGGIGTSHFFVLQLFLLFNLKEETGIAYGVLVNGLTVLFTILAGLMALIIVNMVRIINRRRDNS